MERVERDCRVAINITRRTRYSSDFDELTHPLSARENKNVEDRFFISSILSSGWQQPLTDSQLLDPQA